jgi:hypothetical protein
VYFDCNTTDLILAFDCPISVIVPGAVIDGGVVVLLLEVDGGSVLETHGQVFLVLELLAELDGFGVGLDGLVILGIETKA